MILISSDDFAVWAKEHGLFLNSSFRWVYEPESHESEWLAEQRACDLCGFIGIIIKEVAPNGPYFLSLPGEPWYTGIGWNEGAGADQIRDRILNIFPIPMDFKGVLKFEESGWQDVLLLIATFLVWGWSSNVQFIAGDGRTSITFDHHSVVTIRCPSAAKQLATSNALLHKGIKKAIPPT